MVPSLQERPVLVLGYYLVLIPGSAPHCQAQSSDPSMVKEVKMSTFTFYLQTSHYEMWIHDTSITHHSTKYHLRSKILSLKPRWDIRRVICNNTKFSAIHLSVHIELFLIHTSFSCTSMLDEWLKLWASLGSDGVGLDR